MSLSGITLERYANISLKPVSWLCRSLWGRGGLGGRGFNVDGKKKFFVDRISSNKRPHPRPQCQTSVPFE